MKNPPRYLRLFDVQKYREIQPVIEGIVRRDANAKDVISLLKAAKEVAETDEYKKYNGSDPDQSYAEEMQESVDIIQKSGIKAWFDELNQDQGILSGCDIVYQLYSYICCPKYQWSVYLDLAISDMTVEYETLYYGCMFFDLRLPHMLSYEYLPVEELPQERKGEGTRVSTINRDQFAELAEAADTDFFNLLQLDCKSYTDTVKTREECLEIYKRFDYLFGVANSNTNYTFFMEEHLW
jgi:hypothetical protein